MKKKRQELLDLILEERERQFNLPGSEWDTRNSPNDWIAIVTHYLSVDARRNAVTPDKKHFEASLIKAAAVILAALEHSNKMVDNKDLD